MNGIMYESLTKGSSLPIAHLGKEVITTTLTLNLFLAVRVLISAKLCT